VYSLQQLPPDFSREALVTLGWSTMDALGRLIGSAWSSAGWIPRLVNLDPDPDLLAFLPIVVDPSRQRPPQPVYWPEEWDWAE
jgi:hypothetical protein